MGSTHYFRVKVVDTGFNESGFSNTAFVILSARSQDSLVLVQFYDSTGGSGWTTRTNWKSASPIDGWFGVTLAGDRVQTINLNNNNLTGFIPSSIGQLSELQFLQLYSNSISGNIPSTLGTIPNLLFLELQFNNFSGLIPSSLGDLSALTLLSLAENNLGVAVPPELGNLSSLVTLDLSNCGLQGPIPSELGNLGSLQTLRLNNNALTDTVPANIGNLGNLQYLYLTANGLSGNIPSSFGDLTSLQELHLAGNRFDGLPNVSGISGLNVLDIAYNRFTFEDIEPNIGVATFVYSPQDSVGDAKDTTVVEGQNVQFSVSVGGINNVYQWFLDGNPVNGETSATISLASSVNTDGVYHCEITNNLAPALTLESRTFTLRVAQRPVSQTAAASNITTTSATLNGDVNPNNLSTTVLFQWSTTTAFENSQAASQSPINGSSSVSVTLNLSGLSANTLYNCRIVASNASGADTSGIVQFTTLAIAPAVNPTSIQISDANPLPNMSIIISTQVSGSNPAVKLFFGKPYQNTGDSVTMSFQSGTTYGGSIPGSAVTQDGLWFRIRASNTAGVSYYPSPAGRQQIQVKMNDVPAVMTISQYPGGMDKGQYFTVGMSVNNSFEISDYFGPQQFKDGGPSNWRALTYNVTLQSFEDVTTLTGGKAYFFFQRNADGVEFFTNIVDPTIVGGEAFDETILKPGWNLLAWPYAFWASVTFRDQTKIGRIWWRNGNSSWEAVTALRPFGGYMIYNETAGDVPVGDVIGWSPQASKSNQEVFEWSARFCVKSGEFSDRFNVIGIHPLASEDNDDFDERDPVSIGEGVNAAFIRPDNEAALAYDVRSASTPGNIWTMIVNNSTRHDFTTVSLAEHNLPDRVDLIAYDMHNGQVVSKADLIEGYRFKNDRPVRLRIFAGDPLWAAAALSDFKATLPVALHLAPNVPNPFNPSTTIPYDLPRDGDINLTVYNMVGQKVKTLVNCPATAGHHVAEWDGRDENGRQVSSGVYLLHLKARGATVTRKILLLK